MKALVDATLTAGGVTFYADSLQLARHDSGFYIGGATATVIIPLAEFNAETLLSAISDVRGRTRYVGTWVYGTDVHVDAVSYLKDAQEALDLARRRRETAVYDIAGNTELMV